LRLSSNTITGSLSDQNVTVQVQYDAEGRATKPGAGFSITPLTTTTVLRAYDGYGQVTNETVLIKLVRSKVISTKNGMRRTPQRFISQSAPAQARSSIMHIAPMAC